MGRRVWDRGFFLLCKRIIQVLFEITYTKKLERIDVGIKFDFSFGFEGKGRGDE